MKIQEQLAIRLKDTRVEALQLQKPLKAADKPLTLEIEHELIGDAEKNFLLRFKCEVQHKEGVTLILSFLAEFETNQSVTEEFFKKSFAKINAPAIAYPFLRAYIANFFISSGYNALMLPTINFQAMAEKEREKANGV